MKKKMICLAFQLFCVSVMFGEAVLYPVPSGIPLNPDFRVAIDDGTGSKNVPVQDIVDACFVQFEMTGFGPVELKVTVPVTIDHYRLSPESLNLSSAANGKTLSVTIPEPCKLIILINDNAGNHSADGLDGLLVFAEPPEPNAPQLKAEGVVNVMDYQVDNTGTKVNTSKIQKAFDENAGTKNIIYFPAGIYRSGMLHMRSDQSLYLAPGATLLGSDNYADYAALPGEGHPEEKYLLGSWKANNIRVFGRGIINGNGTALRTQDPAGTKFKTHNIQFMGTNNIEVDGIISMDAGSWSIEPVYCDSVTFRNVKIVSDLRYYGSKLNNDGFDINKCCHVLAEDCLVWCSDDAMCVKQDASNQLFPFRDLHDIVFRKFVVYTRKCAFKIGDESHSPQNTIYDILVEDIDVSFADRSICIWSSEGALLRDVTCKDIRIEKTSTEYKQSHVNCRIDKRGNSIKNLKIINLHAKEPAPKGSVFEGNNLGKTVNGETVQYYSIHFKNYTIGGELVLGLDNAKAGFRLNNDDVGADPGAFTFSETSGNYGN